MNLKIKLLQIIWSISLFSLANEAVSIPILITVVCTTLKGASINHIFKSYAVHDI